MMPKVPTAERSTLKLCELGEELAGLVDQAHDQGTAAEAVDMTAAYLRHFEMCPECGYVEEAV